MRPSLLNKFIVRFIVLLFAVIPFVGLGQTISAGSNTITCGTSYTFTDNGGAGNYIDNTYIVYTICPSTPGQYVSVNFSSASMLYAAASNAGDHLIVLNGGTTTAPIIDDFWSLATINNGPTITSSATDGCLTFIWQSTSGTGTSTGWLATAACSASAGTNSTVCNTYNCQGGCGTTICGSGDYTWTGDNDLNVEELNPTNAGCLSGVLGEMCNTWYYINPESTGTIDFNIQSNSGGDQDFAVWQGSGSTLQCPVITGNSPIRCNYNSMNTSMAMPGTGVWGPWDAGSTYHEASLNVNATDLSNNVYYMVLVNTYNNGGACPSTTATITFGGTALLSCTPPVPLPIILESFSGIPEKQENILTWVTSSQRNNDYFTVQRSKNGILWEDIGLVDGAGTTSEKLFYSFHDISPHSPISYYRLRQTDFDGNFVDSDIISLSKMYNSDDWIGHLIPNPTKDEFGFQYFGKDLNNSVNVVIFDEMGRIVLEDNFVFNMNNRNRTVDVSQLYSGMYRVQFVQNELYHQELLIIQR